MIRSTVIALVALGFAAIGCTQETQTSEPEPSMPVTLASEKTPLPSDEGQITPSMRAAGDADGMKECSECSSNRRTCCRNGGADCWEESC